MLNPQKPNQSKQNFVFGDPTQVQNAVVRLNYVSKAYNLKPIYDKGHATNDLSLLEYGAQKRSQLIIDTRKVTPEPWLSFAKDMKTNVEPRPNARFYKTNLKVTTSAAVAGGANALLIAYGVKNSVENIQNSNDKPEAVVKEISIWGGAIVGGKAGALALSWTGPVGSFLGGLGGSIIGGTAVSGMYMNGARPCNSCLPVRQDNLRTVRPPLANPIQSEN